MYPTMLIEDKKLENLAIFLLFKDSGQLFELVNIYP